MRLHRKAAVALAIGAVAIGGQVVWSGAQAAPDTTNAGISRLQADASVGFSLERNAAGVVDFVGTAAGGSVDNPSVSSATSVRAAARAHLDRYGAALGLGKGSELAFTTSERSASGQDVVRFQQEIGSAPVIGGQVVVSLRPDRQLGSMLSTLSPTRTLPPATVLESAARATAAKAAAKIAGPGLGTTALGRAVWDASIFGATGTAQGVWQFEVGDGGAVRRLVLVDDTSGRVVLNLDQIEHLDRVVCDRNNARSTAATPFPVCSSGFARTETGAVSAVADVNAAFDNAGKVSLAYGQMVGLDLTQAIGIDVGGVKKLASTVRFCQPSGGCPLQNAFWSGTQMYYGQGYAGADDVVGHEMTHGVIDQYSELFYWGQSGAMNESIADIMGEVVDHRNGPDDDSQWLLAEDLFSGGLRNMKDPTVKGEPDRMTSPLWEADTASYGDGGGVHSNSGVGNKTAYLISQGGAFNGQTITGIDGADTGLTKTGKLYFDAITKLTSGSDYANLAAVLEQSCADFVTSGIGGFTAADCDNIKKAVVATELRTTPTNAPQPADAVKSCPTGTTLRELFNSETGEPAAKFTPSAAGIWGYGINADWGSNATSGLSSWFGYNPDPAAGDPPSVSLTASAGIALPAGQRAYLSFQQWRLFEWYAGSNLRYIDGGIVQVNGADTAALPWTNGPEQTLTNYSSTILNQWAGRRAFAGDSFGWVNSQVDLSSFAGQTVTPAFTMLGDSSDGIIGWFLDDISVYTCDVPPVVTPPTMPPAPQPTKVKSTTQTTVSQKGGTVTLTAKVKVTGEKAAGKVTFQLKGTKKKLSKDVKVKKGKARLVLKAKDKAKLGKGKVRVTVTYKGSGTVLASKDKLSFNLR